VGTCAKCPPGKAKEGVAVMSKLDSWDSGDPGNMSLAELELSVRVTNCLESEGILPLGDLVLRTVAELLEAPNFRMGTLQEVKRQKRSFG